MKLTTLNMPEDIFSYIMATIKKADSSEVGGLAVITFDENNVGSVSHHRLLKQKVSAASVDWDPEAHAEYLEWLFTKEDRGGAGFSENTFGLYSWHSHGNMSKYFSNIDEDFISRVGETAPYLFSSVFNKNSKDGEHRLDLFTDLSDSCKLVGNDRVHIKLKDAKLVITHAEDLQAIVDELQAAELEFEAQIALLEADYEERIKEPKARLTAAQKASIEEISKQVDEDFKKYVDMGKVITSQNTRGMVGSGSGYRKPSENGNGSSTQSPKASDTSQASNKDKSGKAGKENGAAPGADGEDAIMRVSDDINEITDKNVLDVEVLCFDSLTNTWGFYYIDDIVKQENLLPKGDIPGTILNLMEPSDVGMIMTRPTYDEYVEETWSNYSKRGGYS